MSDRKYQFDAVSVSLRIAWDVLKCPAGRALRGRTTAASSSLARLRASWEAGD